ncbi:MAG: ABC transporter permease [Pseudomonadales bacterium]|nr:ABC transporter permease [Pseudomonadales bacterium]
MVAIMSPLNIKLRRELWSLRGQIVSIALVVAVGIMSIITMRGSYDSLVRAQQDYYRQSRFADVWVSLVRAPQTLMPVLESLPGVTAADSRVTFLATLDLDDSGIPAHGRFVSVPANGRPLLNDVLIERGRYLAAGASDEVIISSKFAEARGFDPGDTVRAIINGRSRELVIVGIGNSPEHIYAVPPGGLYPEDDRYGVFWASRDLLGPAYNMDGAFNEAVLSLSDDANPQAVITDVDRVLEQYGGLGAYPRADQPSNLILEAELDQNRVSGAVIPMIFLGVAVFLLYLVLGRLIATQRGEIAVLKAFGYRNREVGMHFLMFAVVAVLLGGALGTLGGVYLGDAYIGIYRQYFNLPGLEYRATGGLLLFAFLACTLGAFAGAIAAVLRAVSLPPAEAMRPEAPANFRPGIFERLGLGQLLGSAGRMILRNVERKPLQSFFSSLGIAMSVAILTIGFFMFDSINYMMDLQFRQVQREDISLTFREVVPDSIAFDLSALDGVSRVETYRTIAARLRAGNLEDEIAIQGFDGDGQLRRVLNADGERIPLPAHGLVISSLLADRLQVAVGDELLVEFLEGKRFKRSLPVAAVLDDFLGLSVIMEKTALWQISGESAVVNGAFLTVDSTARPALNQIFKQFPVVTGVSSPDTMLESFREQLADSMLVASAFLLAFAGVIAVGVVYNAARISLSERGRELASLRVMGFHRSEVATLLLGEQGILTLVAIPMGLIIGYGICYAMAIGLTTDIYRIPFVIDPQTIVISALFIIITAAASAWVVRRRLHRLSLVDVLKTRE